MATYQKAQDYAEQLNKALHNWGTATFKAAFSNTAPNLATMAVLADITQIATAGGYTGGAGGGLTLDTVTLTETSGTAKVTIADEVFTATGAVNTFRYVWIYNDTAASDNLVAVYDYGSSITMANGETFTIDFDATNGLWQLV
jgi:hypothetical protein